MWRNFTIFLVLVCFVVSIQSEGLVNLINLLKYKFVENLLEIVDESESFDHI